VYTDICFSGFGSVFTYMVSLSTNVVNFKEKDRGKVCGILNTFFCGSAFVFVQIYNNLLDDGDPNSAQGFANMMMLLAITFGIVGILCVLFLRIYTDNDNEGTDIINTHGYSDNKNAAEVHDNTDNMDNSTGETTHYNSTNTTSQNDETNKSVQNISKPCPTSVKAIMKDMNFHFFLWMFALAAGIGVFVTNNITELASALHFQEYNVNLMIIIPLTTTILSTIIGLVSDKTQKCLSRDKLMIVGLAMFLISEVLYISAAYIIEILILSKIMLGIGISIIWSLGPAIMSEMFHIDNIGRNWGILVFFVAIINFIIQMIYGALYDANKRNPGDLYCYGMNCFRGAFGICIFTSILSIFFNTVLIFRMKQNFDYEHIPLT